MTDLPDRSSAASEYEPVLKKLRFTRDVMKRARMDGKSCLMSIWEQDLQGVEGAIEILSSDGGVENQRHAARGLRTPKTAQDGQEGGPLGSAPEQGHPEKHIAGVVSGPSETIITDDAQPTRVRQRYVAELLLNKRYVWCIVEAIPRVENVIEQFGCGPDAQKAAQAKLDALASQPSPAATVEPNYECSCQGDPNCPNPCKPVQHLSAVNGGEIEVALSECRDFLADLVSGARFDVKADHHAKELIEQADAALTFAQPQPSAGSESPFKEIEPPFNVYHQLTEIGDKNGHVCTAENGEIAKDILAALNIAARSFAEPQTLSTTNEGATDV